MCTTTSRIVRAQLLREAARFTFARVMQDHALPLKRLINFDRIGPVAAGASAGVAFSVSPDDLKLANVAGGMTLFDGTHEIVFWRGSGAEVVFPIEVKEGAGLGV